MRLLQEGSVTGLRVDHPDGLFDPEQYLWRLQEEFMLGCARTAFATQPAYRQHQWAQFEGPVRARIAALLKQKDQRRRWPLDALVGRELAASGDRDVLSPMWRHGRLTDSSCQ